MHHRQRVQQREVSQKLGKSLESFSVFILASSLVFLTTLKTIIILIVKLCVNFFRTFSSYFLSRTPANKPALEKVVETDA
jgi:hypothetical protein